MAVLGSRFGNKVLGLGLGIGVGVVVMTPPAFAQTPVTPPSGVIDPYAAQAAPPVLPPPPPPVVISAPPVPVAPATNNQSGNGNSNNTNSNTVDPVITANPTNTNTSNATNNANNTNTATNNANNTNDNKNDNRSNAAATATNNNTIYIYPPTYTPPPPVPAPVADRSSISPPPLLPPPMLPPYSAASPYYQPKRIRLNCQRFCAPPPPRYAGYTPISPYAPISPYQKKPEKFRVVSLNGHFTVLGMANQPLAGWGTLYGGGISLEFRSRGHFGFEMSQDFLRGSLGNAGGSNFERNSYPFEFTLKGYIMPNSDRNHFNMFFGGGFGVMPSSVDVPLGGQQVANQDFLEWMVHGDVGAELRFKWLALGAEGRIDALYRDRSYGAGALYGGIKDGPVPASTWGVEGRAYLKFMF